MEHENSFDVSYKEGYTQGLGIGELISFVIETMFRLLFCYIVYINRMSEMLLMYGAILIIFNFIQENIRQNGIAMLGLGFIFAKTKDDTKLIEDLSNNYSITSHFLSILAGFMSRVSSIIVIVLMILYLFFL